MILSDIIETKNSHSLKTQVCLDSWQFFIGQQFGNTCVVLEFYYMNKEGSRSKIGIDLLKADSNEKIKLKWYFHCWQQTFIGGINYNYPKKSINVYKQFMVISYCRNQIN